MWKKTLVRMKAREDADSDTFTFTRPQVTSNLWKLQDSYMSAKISFRVGNADNKLSARTIVDYMPQPLNCRAKSFELSLNGVAMTVAHSNSMEVTNAINLLMEKKPMHTDMGGVTMGWLDTPGKMSYLLEVTADNHGDNTRKLITNNIGASKRRLSVVNANPRYAVDKLSHLL